MDAPPRCPTPEGFAAAQAQAGKIPRGMASQPEPPCVDAENEEQRASLAELPRARRWARYAEIEADGDRSNYFRVSCYPITKKAEDDLELISELLTEEALCNLWAHGVYKCAKCALVLYSSRDKWKGPCRWASFRKAAEDDALRERLVFPYNNYNVRVAELYCSRCLLFIGHSFEDGRTKGDSHVDARFRH